MAEAEKVMGVSADDIEKIMGVAKADIEKVMGVEIPSGLAWGGTRAVIAGGTNAAHGDLNRIQYKTVGATANTVDFGDLQTTRSDMSCSGSNGTRGIFGGGMQTIAGATAYGVTDTDYVTIASTGDGTDFGNLDEASSYGVHSGCSNGTLLFSAGGLTPAYGYLDRLEYYTIASTGNGTDAGDISIGNLLNPGATNGDTRFLLAGGYMDPSNAYTDSILYHNFSTSADTSDFGDLTAASYESAGCASTVRAVFQLPMIAFNTMEYVTVASTGDSSDFGDLATGRKDSTGNSDGTSGEFSGGNSGSSGYMHQNMNEIDKITIGTTGNATDIGDLLEINKENGATSGD